jgi:transposase
LNWAQDTGPEVLIFVQQLLQGRAHPEQGYRACLGVLNLSRSYGAKRLNAACARALQLKALRVKSIRSILQQGLDQVPLEVESDTPAIAAHENVRGAHYYQ